MSVVRMHENEVMTDSALVRRLLTAQFPQLANALIVRVRSAGTDNAIYRVGEHLTVRMPRMEGAVKQVEFERAWLPRLAPHLPVEIPKPVAVGAPGEGYQWPWAVNRWLDGEHPTKSATDLADLAKRLGEFVASLRTIDTAGAPPGYRSGRSLGTCDSYVREWTAKARGLIDTDVVLAAWEQALAAPAWDGPPVWTHGDLLSGNILLRGGRLSAVIDWGTAGIGDPACDALPAWTLLDRDSRDLFRATAGFDDATWARARGWALTFVGGITYYRETNPVMAEIGRATIAEVLAEMR